MNLIGRAPARHCTFRASLHFGVWSVTKDGVFYGDYLTRSQAIHSACFGARAVEAVGGSARVLAAPKDEVIAHRHLDPDR